MYLLEYQEYFKTRTRDRFPRTLQYVEGIVLSELKNIERISETLEADYHQFQHFISDSNWDARSLIDQVARDVSDAMPQKTLTGLLIDESGWVKKGNKSGWCWPSVLL